MSIGRENNIMRAIGTANSTGVCSWTMMIGDSSRNILARIINNLNKNACNNSSFSFILPSGLSFDRPMVIAKIEDRKADICVKRERATVIFTYSADERIRLKRG
jgi:hypothetical protein